MADFNKVGLLVVRDNSFLVCRKNNYTSRLIMPGGQYELGESALQCLEREVNEELGDVSLENARYLGTYLDKAASDDANENKTVEIQLYRAELKGTPTPSSEVVELLWFNSASDKNELSAIIANKILPDLIARGELLWS
ncbi:MAG TPA: NUDIX domain-containing protein [Pyrinomonadaceae bacterium]|nr:NUDIX domain-containing protein [Pyrinomonadaceae bacterium]